MANRKLWVGVGVGALVFGALVVGATALIVAPLLSKEQVASGSVLEIHLNGPLAQGPQVDLLAELGLGGGMMNQWDLRRALKFAATDDHIVGALVVVESPAMGFAQLKEVTDEIRMLEAAGKPVHTLLQTDMIGDGNYFASTAGGTVWTTPSAFWMVNGIQGDVTFWKGTLDKLHIEPDYIMMKEYKSAGEPMSRTEMSEYMREAYTEVVGDIQREWISAVAERRGVEASAVEAVLAQGMQSSQAAKDAGLVDHLGYRDEVEEALRVATGADEYKGIKLAKYLDSVRQDEKGDGIAVVIAEGPIVSTGSSDNPFAGAGTIYGPQVAKAIREAAEDDKIKAIVFRVDSPGGSAVGSDLIWREIERAQEKGKPVVVSMASVAGSGGYWVSMGADAIVAEPTTITGSIGVVFGKLNVRGLFELAGANIDSFSTAERADLMSPFHTFTPEERQDVVARIEGLYDGFVEKVAAGRSLPVERVQEIAKGRIWSGIDAKELGLVDELGGLDTAYALAVTKAGLQADQTHPVLYPKPKKFLDLLLEGDLVSTGPALDLAAIELWVDEVSTPRVWAQMPEITLR